MLPLSDAYGSWAASGEIDVMEARGQVPGTVLGTLHHGSRWPPIAAQPAEKLLSASQGFPYRRKAQVTHRQVARQIAGAPPAPARSYMGKGFLRDPVIAVDLSLRRKCQLKFTYEIDRCP